MTTDHTQRETALLAQLGEAKADAEFNQQRRIALAATLNQQRAEIEQLKARVAELEAKASERREVETGMVKEET